MEGKILLSYTKNLKKKKQEKEKFMASDNIHMISSVSTCHRPQHSLRWQYRPKLVSPGWGVGVQELSFFL